MFHFRKVCKTNSSAVYFGSLAIVETIFLFMHIIYELQAAWGVNTYQGPIKCEIFNFLLITPQYMVSGICKTTVLDSSQDRFLTEQVLRHVSVISICLDLFTVISINEVPNTRHVGFLHVCNFIIQLICFKLIYFFAYIWIQNLTFDHAGLYKGVIFRDVTNTYYI